MRTNQESPLLSICCLAYNQKHSLKNTLDSFLAQRTSFRFEIVIHDDASDDGTQEIIQEYCQKYPLTVRAILQKTNLVKSGTGIYDIYTRHVFPELKGKYIAICEGDDYWTDPDKLQLQVEFLESHPEFSICFHHVSIEREGQVDENAHLRNTGLSPEGDLTFTLSDLIWGNMIPNCSVVYRNCITEFPYCFSRFLFPDWPLHILYAEKGDIRYIHRNMAVHHDSSSGMWNGMKPQARREAECAFLLTLLSYLPALYHKTIIDSLQNFSSTFHTLTFWDIYQHALAISRHEKDVMKAGYEAVLNDIYHSRKWKLALAISKVSRLLNIFNLNRTKPR